MRIAILLGIATAIVGCAKADTKAADSAAAAAATVTPAAPAPIKLADVAGKWNVVGKDAATDSTLSSYVLTATADTSGWTITFPNRPPVAMRVVSFGGDSVVTESGSYESVLRKGVKVTLTGASHFKDGKLMGAAIAHYAVKTADSVRNLKTEGTRAP
jgi:hypothetical protein